MHANCRSGPGVSYRVRIRAGLAGMVAVVLGVAGVATAGVAHAARAVGELVSSIAQTPGWGGFDRVSVLEYVTEGPAGATTTATGLLFTPNGTPPPGGWPVIAWDHGTSGMGPQCGITTKQARGDASYLHRLLDQGYAVVAPDYVGLHPGAATPHPYLQSRTEATATIDLVRAARTADADLSTRWAVVGVSQGGHAALNAGALAPTYAPELDFRGTAAFAPPANLEHAIALAGPYVPRVPVLDRVTANIAAALDGMRSAYPTADIDSYFTPAGIALMDRLATLCVADWPAQATNLPLGSLLAKPLLTGDFPDRLAHYLSVPTSGYRQPLLITQGLDDTTVPYPLTAALLTELTASATRYEFHTYPTGHQGIVEASWPQLIPYLTGLFT
ncbi:lipase family protein [Nocardia sp. NPDC004604]|uniref:lipase family protein n=1 Tax=Nocardia sp. NPDC004604 TaxID=3157013 RepID=UPI0033BA3709